MIFPNSFRLGSHTINPALLLAPMAGVTGKSFRAIIRERNPGAVGIYYSEFASVEGLVRANKSTLRLIERSEEDKKDLFAVQLFGMRPAHMAEAAKIAVDHGADIVDINAGCPAQKVVKKGGGADLLKKPLLIGEIVAAVRAAVNVPVTLKIRVGWDEKAINALEVARIGEEAGIDLLTVHGRTRNQGFSGSADWNLIRLVKEQCRVPVIGNGDIIDTVTAQERTNLSHVDGLMIGRGILRDPWVFRKLVAAQAGTTYEPIPEEQFQIFMDFADRLAGEGLPLRAILGQLKQLAVRFLKGKPHGAEFRTQALRSLTLEPFYEAVRGYIHL